MKKVAENFIASPKIESLEERRHMSSVQLIDGMLVLQGKVHGNNRLTVSADDNGTTLYARANKVKAHYLIKDIKTIRIIGGEADDIVDIDSKLSKSSYVRVGCGNDSVKGGSGSDTVFGGNGGDTLVGAGGDDLLFGQAGPDNVVAGNGDDPEKLTPRKNSKNSNAVTKLVLVSAEANSTIGTLTDGAILNLNALPKKLNISAQLKSANGSVRFVYDGYDSNRIENNAPFALAADSAGDFNGWTPKVGTHTLTVTPYSGKNATGEFGTALTVTFKVVEDETTPALTGAGATPSEIKDDQNPTSVDNKNAPNAVIDVMATSVPEDTAIHVNALKSALNEGSAIDAQYEWDFGDEGSKYNKLTGFNAAHAYTKAGTYRVTLTVTNSAGKRDSVTTQVTVTAANRRFIYVSPDGNDSSSGANASNAVKTFARAAQLVDDNTEVLFERGGVYSTKVGMHLSHSNVVVGAYGTGAKPIVKYTGGDDYNSIFHTMEGKNITIKDLAFDSSNTSTGNTGYNDGVRAGGQNITVRDCTFINVGYAVNTNGFPDGVLVQDNNAPNKNSIRSYFAWVQGADHVYLGNSAKDSLHGHNLRIGGADRVNIQHNNFTNLDATAGMRGTLTIHKGSYVYIAHNTLEQGSLNVGPLGHDTGLSDKSARMKWVVIEDNVIKSPVHLVHGTEHVSVRNNVILKDDDIAIDIPGYSGEYGRGITDVYIVHNTVVNKGTTGKFLKVGGAVSGVTVTNNLYVAPNLTTGAYSAAPIVVQNSDLAGFRLISDNIWPEPTILAGANGGINYVGNDGDNSGYKTPAEWEAYKVVVHDQYEDVSLGSTYKITLGGITAGADLKRAA